MQFRAFATLVSFMNRVRYSNDPIANPENKCRRSDPVGVSMHRNTSASDHFPHSIMSIIFSTGRITLPKPLLSSYPLIRKK